MRIPTYDLSTLAYEKVREMIISKKLEAGKKIVQDKLAEELGISRTPLRAALKMLESENLIESIPRKGMMVKKYANKEILEIYDCRIAIESMAVRLFTERANESDIKKLFACFRPYENGNIELEKYQRSDSNFHSFILEKCGNKMLNQLFRQGNLLLCIDMIGLVRPPEETLSEHMDIISAIKDKDSDQAEELVKVHLNRSKKLIVEKMHQTLSD